jgi:hypothetical protein
MASREVSIHQPIGHQIPDMERHENWPATARRKDGRRVAIMRGRPGGGSEGRFYLYEEGWRPSHPATRPMPSYSANEIKNMLGSGDLVLLRGVAPEELE